jgi:hypothetical protein
MSKTALIGIASVAAVADAFAPGGGFIAPSLALRGSGASRLGHASAACRFGGGRGGSSRGLHGLRAQENKGGEEKGIVDKIADKGIWQFGVSKDVGDALSKVGWADNSEEGAAEGAEGEGELEEGMRVKELPRFEREDIEGLVAKAVAAEIFADDRSKEVMGIDDVTHKHTHVINTGRHEHEHLILTSEEADGSRRRLQTLNPKP